MTMWAIAHRGASDEAPENTLVAFQRALEQGADALECDVHLSADGEVVVIHDDTVDRTTDGTGAVAGMTLEELHQLDAGSWKGPQFAGQRIPTLQEIIELLGETIPLFIEFKGSSPELPQKVADLLRETQMQDRAWLFAAHHPTLKQLRRLSPESNIRWREGMELGDFVLTWPERLTGSVVAIYRQRGMRVFATVVDRTPNSRARREIARMAELGINGVICNRVWLLRQVLDAR